MAVASGISLSALVVGLLFLGSEPFFGFAFAVILVAQGEFYQAARKAGRNPATALGLVGGALLMGGVFFEDESAAGIVLFLTLVFCFVWYLAIENPKRVGADLAVTMLGIVYIPLLGSFAGLLARRPDGRAVTIVAIGLVVLYDTAAYAGGRTLGKTPLAPAISPNKTREGALVATAFTTVAALVAGPAFGPWNAAQAILLGLGVAVAAPAGDLFESALKRDLGIKDMGFLIPGHGGALDRIDAMLFALPVVYFSLRVFGL